MRSCGEQPGLLRFKGVFVDRVVKAIPPAAFRDHESETTPTAREAAEALLAWETAFLHLSRSACLVF